MSDEATKHKTQTVPISRLKPHPRNYNHHPDSQLTELAVSLRKHGQFRNVVVAKDWTILAGHGVVEALDKKLGATTVEVKRLPIDPDSPQALEIVVLDNEMGHLAEKDDRLLAALLGDIRDSDELLGTGYDDAMLANLLYVTRPSNEIASFNEAAQWVGLPAFEAYEKEPSVLIRFDSPEQRDEFCDQLKLESSLTRGKNFWSAWWPPRDRGDPSNAKFVDTVVDEPPAAKAKKSRKKAAARG